MQSPPLGLKFCCAQARVACLVLARAATRVTFRHFFEFISTKQYSVLLKSL